MCNFRTVRREKETTNQAKYFKRSNKSITENTGQDDSN